MSDKPVEKHLNVYVIPMQIVQMYNIRINLVELGKKPSRCRPRVKSGTIIKTSLENIEVEPYLGPKIKFVVILSSPTATPRAPALVTRGKPFPLDLPHY